jgi:DNA-binding MarR family transcriptional regulator
MAVYQGVTQPAMTQLVTRLERDGYAVRGSDPSDARVVLVDLTDAGRAVLAERRELRASRMSELLDTLPADDREVILGALPALKLLASLDQADERSLSQ